MEGNRFNQHLLTYAYLISSHVLSGLSYRELRFQPWLNLYISDHREKFFVAATRDGRRSVGLWRTHPAAREKKTSGAQGIFVLTDWISR